jgi:hypothetical protein
VAVPVDLEFLPFGFSKEKKSVGEKEEANHHRQLFFSSRYSNPPSLENFISRESVVSVVCGGGGWKVR